MVDHAGPVSTVAFTRGGIVSQSGDSPGTANDVILFTKLQTISNTMHSRLVSNDP